MRKKFLYLLAVLSFVLGANLAFGQSYEVVQGEPFVVTASRNVKKVDWVTQSITLIDREVIEKYHLNTLEEALRFVAGVDIAQSGVEGSSSSIFLRGTNSSHTLVLVDGVEFNDPINPSRSSDIGLLDLSGVERIEVLRGSQSVLYGSDAIGGVIHVITKKGIKDGSQCSLQVEGGSFDEKRANLSYGASQENLSVQLNLNWKEKGGISTASEEEGNTEEDELKQWSSQGRLTWTSEGKSELNLFGKHYSSELGLDNGGGAFQDDINHKGEEDLSLMGIEFSQRDTDSTWSHQLAYRLSQRDRDIDNPSDDIGVSQFSRSSFESSVQKFNWQAQYRFSDELNLSGGLEFENEKGESESSGLSSWGSYGEVFNEEESETQSAYFLGEWDNDFFHGTLGARYDDHERFGSEVTGRVSFRINPISSLPWAIKGSASSGFKAPSLYQLYSSYGHLDLEPEKSNSYEFGILGKSFDGRLNFELILFQIDIEDLIDFDYGTFSYSNLKEADSKGLEAVIKASLTQALTLDLTYTYTETEDGETKEDLLRRPKNKVSSTLFFQANEQLSFALSHHYVGKRFDLDFSSYPSLRTEMEEYHLVNLSVNCKINPSWDCYLKVENILDEEYEEVLGYGTYPLGAFIGVKWKKA